MHSFLLMQKIHKIEKLKNWCMLCFWEILYLIFRFKNTFEFVKAFIIIIIIFRRSMYLIYVRFTIYNLQFPIQSLIKDF